MGNKLSNPSVVSTPSIKSPVPVGGGNKSTKGNKKYQQYRKRLRVNMLSGKG